MCPSQYQKSKRYLVSNFMHSFTKLNKNVLNFSEDFNFWMFYLIYSTLFEKRSDLDENVLSVSFIAFARNAKRFAIDVLLPSAVFERTCKSFLLLFHHSLPNNSVTKIGLFHWTHWPMFLSVFLLLQNFVYATLTCHVLYR